MEPGGEGALPTELVALAAHDDAVFVAFDRTGATSAQAPEAAAKLFRNVWVMDAPLEGLTRASQPTAVALFETARRHGMASSVVQVTAVPDVDFRLFVFDLTEHHDCFAGVVLAERTVTATGAGISTEPLPVVPRYMVVRLDVSGVFVSVDRATTVALGWLADELLGRSILDFLHPDDHEAGLIAWVELLQAPGAIRRLRQRFRRADGSYVWMEVTETNHFNEPDEDCAVVELVDIAEEMAALVALREREELLAQLTESLPTGVLQVTPDGEIRFCNSRWAELLDLDPQAEAGAMLDLVDEGTRAALIAAFEECAELGLGREMDLAITTATGRRLIGRLHLRHLEADSAGSVLLTLEDITERHELQLQLLAQATRDALTGLLNRTAVMDGLRRCLDTSGGSLTGVLFVDLDNFKSVNDRFGHAAGDRLLCSVADALRSTVRPGDLIGRIGGDEFVVVAPELPATATVERLAERIAAAVETLHVEDASRVGATIGVAVAVGADDAEHLLARADADMYTKKRATRR